MYTLSGLKLSANNKIWYYILINKAAFDQIAILLTRVSGEFISMTNHGFTKLFLHLSLSF